MQPKDEEEDIQHIPNILSSIPSRSLLALLTVAVPMNMEDDHDDEVRANTVI